MSFKVFISHSVNPRELAIVYALAEEAGKQGIDPFIPDRQWVPQSGVPARITTPILAADAMVVVATKFGAHPHFVASEMNAFDRSKPLVAVLDPEATLNITQPAHRVVINRQDLSTTVFQASEELKSLQMKKAGKDALTWLVVGGLLFMLFQENKQ